MSRASYCFSSGLTRLKSLNPDFVIKDWCFEKKVYDQNIPNYEFWNIEGSEHDLTRIFRSSKGAKLF